MKVGSSWTWPLQIKPGLTQFDWWVWVIQKPHRALKNLPCLENYKFWFLGIIKLILGPRLLYLCGIFRFCHMIIDFTLSLESWQQIVWTLFLFWFMNHNFMPLFLTIIKLDEWYYNLWLIVNCNCMIYLDMLFLHYLQCFCFIF